MDVTKIGKRFEGKVAIVTASTNGIGFGIAERLGLEGASVVVSSRNQENVNAAVEKLRGRKIEVLGVVCHIGNAQQRKDLIHKTLEKYGKIDVVVSNAGVNPSAKHPYKVTILGTEESALDKLWEINVKAQILLIKEVAPYLKKGSSVVLASSIGAFQQPALLAVYAVTKTALLGLTKGLAQELSPGVRVNCVAPGAVPTRFGGVLTEDSTIRKMILDLTLLKRLGTIEEIAAATAFIASDDAAYITGETLVVAGGMPSRL